MVAFHEYYATIFAVVLLITNGLSAYLRLLVWGSLNLSALGLLIAHKMGQLRDFGLTSMAIVSVCDADVERRVVNVLCGHVLSEQRMLTIHLLVCCRVYSFASIVWSIKSLAIGHTTVATLHRALQLLHYWTGTGNWWKFCDGWDNFGSVQRWQKRALTGFDTRRTLAQSRLIMHLVCWHHARWDWTLMMCHRSSNRIASFCWGTVSESKLQEF